MKIDKERGVLNIVPKINLTFLPDESVAHYRDVKVFVPNIALIVSIFSSSSNFINRKRWPF